MTHGNFDSNASGTALIVIDIQNDYFPGGKLELAGSIEAGERAGTVLEIFRTKKLPVIHIQHEWKGENPPFFAPGSKGQKINDCVIPVKGEKVFVKYDVSSFKQTPLLQYLKDQNIKRLIIAGMQTDMCVTGTVKDGIKNRFEIVVVKDAVAAKDAETNKMALAAIEAEGAEVIDMDSLVSIVAE